MRGNVGGNGFGRGLWWGMIFGAVAMWYLAPRWKPMTRKFMNMTGRQMVRSTGKVVAGAGDTVMELMGKGSETISHLARNVVGKVQEITNR